jgi:hypothetical protein
VFAHTDADATVTVVIRQDGDDVLTFSVTAATR